MVYMLYNVLSILAHTPLLQNIITFRMTHSIKGGSITRPLVLFDPLSYVILSTSMRRGWGGVFHVITEFVMMLVVGLVEGCLSLSEMEPLTVRSPLILPCIVV